MNKTHINLLHITIYLHFFNKIHLLLIVLIQVFDYELIKVSQKTVSYKI